MIKQSTLNRIKIDIGDKNYGKARDRLHSLIFSYPNELHLRKQLGDIYYHLDYPEMAGRYWFLEEIKTPEMELACTLFTKSFKTDNEIRGKLKFKGNISELKSDYAIEKLKSIGYIPIVSLSDQVVEKTNNASKGNPLLAKLFPVGCVVLIALVVIFAIVGFATVITNIF